MDKRIAIALTTTVMASAAGLAAVLLTDSDRRTPSATIEAQVALESATALATVPNAVKDGYRAELASNLATLADTVLSLQRQVASLEHRIEQHSSAEPGAEFAELQAIQDAPYLAELEAPSDPFGLDEQQEMDIEMRFEEQPVEAAWSAVASDQIMRAIEQSDLPQSSVMALNCRSSICRAEVDAFDPEQRQDFLRSLPLHLGAAMPLDEVSATYEQDDLTGSMVLHMSFAEQGG